MTYHINHSIDNQFVGTLKSPNGKIRMTTETYRRRRAAVALYNDLRRAGMRDLKLKDHTKPSI